MLEGLDNDEEGEAGASDSLAPTPPLPPESAMSYLPNFLEVNSHNSNTTFFDSNFPVKHHDEFRKKGCRKHALGRSLHT